MNLYVNLYLSLMNIQYLMNMQLQQTCMNLYVNLYLSVDEYSIFNEYATTADMYEPVCKSVSVS